MYHPYIFPGERCRKDSSSSGNGEYGYIKPAPQDPLAVIKLGEVLNSIFPPGVVNVIVGSSPDIGAALVDSSDVNMISFTGSSMVGAKSWRAVENYEKTTHGAWRQRSFNHD